MAGAEDNGLSNFMSAGTIVIDCQLVWPTATVNESYTRCSVRHAGAGGEERRVSPGEHHRRDIRLACPLGRDRRFKVRASKEKEAFQILDRCQTGTLLGKRGKGGVQMVVLNFPFSTSRSAHHAAAVLKVPADQPYAATRVDNKR